MESFESIAEALVASYKVKLFNLDRREELQYLAYAAKLGNKRITWSLIRMSLISSLGEPWYKEDILVRQMMFALERNIAVLMRYCREDYGAQLMNALENNVEVLMRVAADKFLLEDILATLVRWSHQASPEHTLAS